MSATELPAPGFVLVIHGGAGVIEPPEMTPERDAACRAGLQAALQAGEAVLRGGGSALDGVVAAVKSLEDCPLFNAGRGAVLNDDGIVELDAAIMDGATHRAGAVAAVQRVRNPVEAARCVMESSPHVLLVGNGAETFAVKHGLVMVPPAYFVTSARREQWQRMRTQPVTAQINRAAGRMEDRSGTVGAVALDLHGHVAAATSTGGIVRKHPGRVGDTPLIGAGTYANDATCAVSGTGQGEYFMRCVAAHTVSALMEYRGLDLSVAAEFVIHQRVGALGGQGGLIAVDRAGRIALPFNSPAMYRGWLRADGTSFIGIHRTDPAP